MDLRDAAFLEDDMANGFKIYVHPSSIQPFMLPMPASSNTETFIKVTASRRLLNEKKCVPVDRPPPLMEGAYYDPYGYTCLADKHQRWAYKHFDCYMPFFHYRPNRSETCTPHMLYFFFESITSDVQKIYRRERVRLELSIVIRWLSLCLWVWIWPLRRREYGYDPSELCIRPLSTRIWIPQTGGYGPSDLVHTGTTPHS